MGHAFAQIPQAMHLLGFAAPAGITITFMGHASTHLPQPTLTGPRTLAALDTHRRLHDILLLLDADTGLPRIELLVKSLRTGRYTGKASHTLAALFHGQFLHFRSSNRIFPSKTDLYLPIKL